MIKLIVQFNIALLLSGCIQQTVIVPALDKESWVKSHSSRRLLHPFYNKNIKADMISKKDENLSDSNITTQKNHATEVFPETIKEIPVINDISKVIPSVTEIPIINQVTNYFSKRPGNSHRRLRGYIPSTTSMAYENQEQTTKEKFVKNDDYAQYFSGGLHYDKKIFLKKIKVYTDKEQHTIIKFVCTNISPYTAKYDPEKKIVVIALKECTVNKNNLKLILPRHSIIKESRIEYLPEGTRVTLQLKQDAKINVLESYDPTYISIDITPMYRLYIGDPS